MCVRACVRAGVRACGRVCARDSEDLIHLIFFAVPVIERFHKYHNYVSLKDRNNWNKIIHTLRIVTQTQRIKMKNMHNTLNCSMQLILTTPQKITT